jgi:hypothetical protein
VRGAETWFSALGKLEVLLRNPRIAQERYGLRWLAHAPPAAAGKQGWTAFVFAPG